jgi:hypothetical protein
MLLCYAQEAPPDRAPLLQCGKSTGFSVHPEFTDLRLILFEAQ